MTLRRVVFWSHLTVAVLSGVVVLMMSATGVLLTYERQIVAFAERQAFTVAARDGPRLDADQLADHAAAALGEGAALVFEYGRNTPVRATAGRRDQAFLDPYTGEVLGSGVAGVEAFFGFVTGLHRWLALDGASRGTARAITGATNLMFLFILVSGAFLWWPRRWRWSLLRTQLLFRRGLPTAKARDYNWHHVFGVWALAPLLLIVVSGVVISYPWASDLVFRAYGEEPARGRPSAGGGERGAPQGAAPADPVPLDRALAAVKAFDPNWRTITLHPPRPEAPMVIATVDTGNGAQAALRRTVTISRADASVVAVQGNEAVSPGRRARTWMRFIHTGEVYGIVGQTVAGLASLAAVFLVYTGLALAFRRLVLPLFRRRVPARPAGLASRAPR